MTELDPFEAGRDRAEERRRELEALRADLRAVVREEVGKAGVDESELRRMVADLVREQLGGRAGSGRPLVATPVVLAVGLIVGLAGGVLGYRAMAGTPDDAGRALEPRDVAAAASDSGDVRPPPGPVAPTSPAERAARYDSLFAARGAELAALVARLESAGPAAPVSSAIQAWRAGETLDEAGRRRLHDALVQLSLNDLGNARLALDGLLTRGPCRGNSCGALLRMWEARGAEMGMPAYPDDAAEDSAALGVAERTLILHRLESGGA